MERKIIANRWWVIAASVVFTLGMGSMLLKLEIDPDLRNYFPATMESMVHTDSIEAVFGNQDQVMVIFEAKDILNEETLGRVQKVERGIRTAEGIKRVNSLFGSNRIHGEEGIMYVEPTVLRIPRTEEEKEELRRQIKENDMVYRMIVADDFRSTALIATLEKEVNEEKVFHRIDSVLNAHPGPEKIHYGGLPYLRQAIDSDIKRDGLTLIPIALILMIIFLYLVFREWRGVWLPFLVVVMSALVGLALIPLLGWKFYIITLLVPILLIAVANDYGIHMIAKYQELNTPGNGRSMKRISARITRALWQPVTLTGITTIAGISALWAHSMIPARQMAVVAGIGILFAIFFSLVLLPALLSLLRKPAAHPHFIAGSPNSGKKLMDRFARAVIRRRRIIPLTSLLVTLAVAVGILFLKVDSNEENFFPEKHEVKQAARLINSKFGGSENISVMFRGDMLDPGLLNRMEEYRARLEKMEFIDQTISFSGVVREISKALNDPGEKLYDQIPPSREAVAQYMTLYSMNADPGELEQLVDFNYQYGHLVIRINDANRESVQKIMQEVRELTAEDPAFVLIGGYGYVRSQLADKVITGTVWSLGIALLTILLLLALIFRSAVAGFLGIIPVTISVVILLGIMGWTGVRLDVATALLSSIMIGVGIDYTIHFLWRYREELKKERSYRKAVHTTLTTTGRGIIFNALSVMVGFVVLLISSFTPIRFFGLLVVVSIFSCLVGALVILPSLVLLLRPRFLEPSAGADPSREKYPQSSGTKTGRLRSWKKIAVFLIPLTTLSLLSPAQDAREIMELSHDAVKVSSFEAVSTLTIRDSRGNERIRKNTMASMSLEDGTEKRIIKFIAPPEVEGTGILIFDYPEKSDDMWIYLPALRKTRRIVSREKSKSFMGSEFSNANMSAPGLDDFTYRITGTELIGGHDCHLVESVPADASLEETYGYSRSVSWVDRSNYLVHKTEYFNFAGDHFKTITNHSFVELEEKNQRYMVDRMEAVNHDSGRSSEMVMEKVQATSTDPSYFTISFLERE